MFIGFLKEVPHFWRFFLLNRYVDFHKKIAYAKLQKHVSRSYLGNEAQTFSKMYILQKHSVNHNQFTIDGQIC